MNRFFRPELEGLRPYIFGKISKEKVIKLNANESNYNLPSDIQESINTILEDTDISKYHILDEEKTSNLFQEFIGYGIENIIIDNGSSAIIKNVMNSVLRPGDTVLTFGPTFTLYKNIAEGIGADYKELSFQEKQNIPSVDEISKFNPKLIILCSPNNPTGHITQKEQIKKLLNNNKDTLVLVDEAYIDFGGESSIDLVEEFDNLIVSRTFSKAYSIAGARLGYAVGSEYIISTLQKLQLPYHLNIFALSALYSILGNTHSYKGQIKEILEVRDYTQKKLEEMGFYVRESHANFLLIEYQNKNISAESITHNLEKKGILVRYFKGQSEISNSIRVSIGTRKQMDILLQSLKLMLS